jgi:putative hydrolase of the HAD superfamily
MGLIGYFDFVLTSAEAGFKKPHPQIFSEALRRAGVSAAHAIHIGDSLVEDARGAFESGIKPILLIKDQTDTPDFAEIELIRDLSELLPGRSGAKKKRWG